MHDIDRTQLEFQPYAPGETVSEEAGAFESPLTEGQEIELASEFLEISNEQQLEQFLGNLMQTVGGAVGRFASSDTGRALGGILKGAARQALPVVGRAVGQWVRPDGGGAIGANIASQAGRLFGLELEGLSSEDQEFEVARQFVRFAGAAAKQASVAPSAASPIAAARAAAFANSASVSSGSRARRSRWLTPRQNSEAALTRASRRGSPLRAA